jgi:hypothetical protein
MKYNQADQGADAEHPAIEREANGDCSHKTYSAKDHIPGNRPEAADPCIAQRVV